jgi:hypothetical protein
MKMVSRGNPQGFTIDYVYLEIHEDHQLCSSMQCVVDFCGTALQLNFSFQFTQQCQENYKTQICTESCLSTKHMHARQAFKSATEVLGLLVPYGEAQSSVDILLYFKTKITNSKTRSTSHKSTLKIRSISAAHACLQDERLNPTKVLLQQFSACGRAHSSTHILRCLVNKNA